MNIFDQVVRYKQGPDDTVLKIEPDLASSWEISDDGLVHTFHLREGGQFHKGYGELTSEDVVFTIERAKDPESGSAFSSDLQVIESIEAVDRYTVRMTLAYPYSDFFNAILAWRPGFIVCKKAVLEKGSLDFKTDPIGTGPYSFSSRVAGVSLTLKASKEPRSKLRGVERRNLQV